MPPTRAVLHPRFVTHIPHFFVSRVRIEEAVMTQDARFNEETPSGFVTIYDNVHATITPVTRLGEEWRNWRLEFVLEQVTHRIMLKGLYPNILATHRMIDIQRGEIHNIVSRHLDSKRHITRMDTRIVHPAAIEGIS